MIYICLRMKTASSRPIRLSVFTSDFISGLLFCLPDVACKAKITSDTLTLTLTYLCLLFNLLGSIWWLGSMVVAGVRFSEWQLQYLVLWTTFPLATIGFGRLPLIRY